MIDSSNLLEKGKLYSICKISAVVLVNFPTNNSLKIHEVEKISKIERDKLKEYIDEILKVNLWSESLLCQMLVVALHHFSRDTDLIICNTAGVADQNIVLLEEYLALIAQKLNKIAIVNRGNSRLCDEEGLYESLRGGSPIY